MTRTSCPTAPTLFFVFCVIFGGLALCSPAAAQTSVVTQHNNLKRTGWNNTETILDQAQVSGGNFGKLFSLPVDDQVYAQPLVISGVAIGGGIHSIVLVATVNNSVYAFNADSSRNGVPYWQKSLTYNPGNTNSYRAIKNKDMTGACEGNYYDFSGNMGIVGTPVVDTTTQTMYVVARSVTLDGLTFVQYLHALDITTGNERPGSPVLITASVPGTGAGSSGGTVNFDAQHENPRPGLLLYNGVVYISWASHCDWSPYHGWIIGYDKNTLQQKYVYNDTPDGALGGIWMSGQAPAVDDQGNIYVTTGNGNTGRNGNANDTTERGESLLKLSTSSGKLKVTDFFTPDDYAYLNQTDLDYGVDGVLLIPNTNLSLSGSKESYLYLIRNDSMGGTTGTNSNVVQQLNINADGTGYAKFLHGSPVYFKDNNNQESIYAWAAGGLLKQFPFNRTTGLFDTLNKKLGVTVLPQGLPGAMLAVSSNGNKAGTGILWASHPINGDANSSVVPGILQAFDATDVSHELWNTNWNGKRDAIGKFAKFVPPTIANGKVYMATFSNELQVYGLNPPPASSCGYPLPAPWRSADLGYVVLPGDVCDSSGSFTLTASGDDIWNGADAFHYVFQGITGNTVEMTARVKSMQNTNPWSKCGIMFRANLDPGSPQVMMALTTGNGAAFQDRLLQDSSSYNSSTAPLPAPYWVRILKTGNKYVGYISANGNTWTAIDSVTLTLGTYPYAGLAYTAHNTTLTGTAVIDHVTLVVDGSLPLDIVRMQAQNIDNRYTQLNWQTENEELTDHFLVERSTPGTDFIPLGTVKSNADKSAANSYTFQDPAPADGINFYRLAEVNRDGKISYSGLVSASFNFTSESIFPNPAQNDLYLRDNPNFSQGGKITVLLTDYLGHTLYRQTLEPALSGGLVHIKLSESLPNGLYVLTVLNAAGKKQGQKIFINR